MISHHIYFSLLYAEKILEQGRGKAHVLSQKTYYINCDNGKYADTVRLDKL